MEGKYNFLSIHSAAGMYVHLKIHDQKASYAVNDEFFKKVIVFIEIKGSKDLGYILAIPENTFAAGKGSRPSGIIQMRMIKNPIISEELYENRDLLGEVTIYYERKPFGNPFPTYDEFWKEMTR